MTGASSSKLHVRINIRETSRRPTQLGRGIGCHERCESSCPQKAHSSSTAISDRRPRRFPLHGRRLSSTAEAATKVSSRRAPPPMRIPRAWIKGRALGWLVLIYPRASVFPLLLFRRFSRAPDHPCPSRTSSLRSSRGASMRKREKCLLQSATLPPSPLPSARRCPFVIIPRELGAPSS